MLRDLCVSSVSSVLKFKHGAHKGFTEGSDWDQQIVKLKILVAFMANASSSSMQGLP